MFETLVESGHHRPAPARAGAMALAVHVVVVAFAVEHSQSGPTEVHRPIPIEVFIDEPSPQPSTTTTSSGSTDEPGIPSAAPSPDFVPGPVSIDPLQFDSIRPIDPGTDLRSAIINDARRTGLRNIGSDGNRTITDGIHLAGEVDDPVRILQAASPRYPRAQEAAGLPGRVVLQFVVDTSGAVEQNSIRVVSATDSAFALAGREAVSATRFSPARARGQLVRQLVRQSVEFRQR